MLYHGEVKLRPRTSSKRGRVSERHVYEYSKWTYLKTNGEEPQQFQAHLVAEVVELANRGFIALQTGRHGLLSLTILKLLEIKGSEKQSENADDDAG